jgi:hypothetical protein
MVVLAEDESGEEVVLIDPAGVYLTPEAADQAEPTSGLWDSSECKSLAST